MTVPYPHLPSSHSDLDTVWFTDDAIGWNLKALDRIDADVIGMDDGRKGGNYFLFVSFLLTQPTVYVLRPSQCR